jgi:hypothetical protein
MGWETCFLVKFSSLGLPSEYHIFWVELGLCSFLDLRSLLSTSLFSTLPLV